MNYRIVRSEELIFDSRDDAIQVLETLKSCAKVFGVVSLSDYYNAAKGYSKVSDNVYGWRCDTITAAGVLPVRSGGYTITLSPLVKLDLK